MGYVPCWGHLYHKKTGPDSAGRRRAGLLPVPIYREHPARNFVSPRSAELNSYENGKPRLPKEQLLRQGRPAAESIDWLSSQPEVKETIAQPYSTEPISERNATQLGAPVESENWPGKTLAKALNWPKIAHKLCHRLKTRSWKNFWRHPRNAGRIGAYSFGQRRGE